MIKENKLIIIMSKRDFVKYMRWKILNILVSFFNVFYLKDTQLAIYLFFGGVLKPH
jgi:hypothetical protein